MPVDPTSPIEFDEPLDADLVTFAQNRAKELGYGDSDETPDVPTEQKTEEKVEEVKEEVSEENPETEAKPEPKVEDKPTLTKRELRLLEQTKAVEAKEKEVNTLKAELETLLAETKGNKIDSDRLTAELTADPVGYLRSLGFTSWDKLVRDSYNEYLGDDASPEHKISRQANQIKTEVEKRLEEKERILDEKLQALDDRAKAIEAESSQAKFREYVAEVQSSVNKVDPEKHRYVSNQLKELGAETVVNNVLKIADYYATNHQILVTPEQALQVLEEELDKLVAPHIKNLTPNVEQNSPVVDDSPGTLNNTPTTRGGRHISDEFNLDVARQNAAKALFGE